MGAGDEVDVAFGVPGLAVARVLEAAVVRALIRAPKWSD
jgi:hypothetical protein